MKRRISVLMTTARSDYSLFGMPSIHIFDLLLELLKRQSLKNFELIVVDSLYEERKDYFKRVKTDFPVKHVPPKPSLWMEKDMCHIANDWNTGIIHAEGELIVRLDDWTKPAVFSDGYSDFDVDYLSKMWTWYKKGRWPIGLSVFYQNVNVESIPPSYREHYKKLFGEDPNGENIDRKLKVLDIIYRQAQTRDYRFVDVEQTRVANIGPDKFSGFCAVPLEPLLDVNGIDELFDGCKCLEDVDLGYRLDHAGYHDRFILDRELTVIEYHHKPPHCFNLYGHPFKSNVGLALMNHTWKRWRANANPLTDEQINFVRKETVERIGKFNEKMFQFWLQHQPIFNLRKMRKKCLKLTT